MPTPPAAVLPSTQPRSTLFFRPWTLVPFSFDNFERYEIVVSSYLAFRPDTDFNLHDVELDMPESLQFVKVYVGIDYLDKSAIEAPTF